MSAEYVPGKCNIGARGRAMRLSTGVVVLALSALAGFILLQTNVPSLARLVLAVPLYGGMISILEGLMSFCVFHAARGTYDLQEKRGPIGRSDTRVLIESEEWKRIDRRKARVMHLEAVLFALVITAMFFLV